MALLCGSLNTFHLLVILTWQFMILFATQMLFGIFTTFTPKWRCSPTPSADQNLSVALSPFGKDCSVYESCETDQIEFESIPFASAAVDFQWICGTGAYTKALYSQLQFFGVLLGTVVLAPLSDTFGRKPIGLITFSFGLLSLALSALSPNWQFLLFGRFLISFLMGGSLVVVATFTMEIMPPKHRMILRTFCNWGISRLILTSLCFFFPDWRSASVVSALVSVPGLLIIAFLLPESPIWLHSQNRLDAMLRSERQIARLAGVEHAPMAQRAPVSKKKANFRALIRDRSLFSRLLVLWMMWFTSSMSSYSVDLNSSNLSGDLFLNQLLLSVPVILSKLMLLSLDTYMPKFSRRNLHHFSQLIVVFCFVLLTLLILLKYEGQTMVLVMNQLGNVFIQFTWDACYLSGTELMPTVLRASAMASFSLVAQFGALIAPTLVFFNDHWGASAYLAVALLGSANLFVSWMWLVDTKGVDLDEVILDGESAEGGEAKRKRQSWTGEEEKEQTEGEEFLTKKT